METSSEHQPAPEGESAKGDLAGWHIPKPETIPAPTYWPFVLSLGATLIGLGILTSNIISATGTVLFILATIKWIGELASDARRQR